MNFLLSTLLLFALHFEVQAQVFQGTNGVQFKNLTQAVITTPKKYHWKPEPTRVAISDLKDIFAEATLLDLPYLYTYNCCSGRAYEISKSLATKKINTFRVFIEGSLLRPKNLFSDSRPWEMHTAPAVLDDKGQVWVIDPALAQRALRLKEWIQMFTTPTTVFHLTFSSPFIMTAGDFDHVEISHPNAISEELASELIGCQAIQDRLIRDKIQNTDYSEFPFNKKLNLMAVKIAGQLQGESLLRYMKNSGVEIYVFRSHEKSKKSNPLLRNLKEISAEKGTRLDLEHEGDSGTHGLFVAPGSLFSDLEKPTIFIHEEAETYSLIHEYLHFLFWKESKDQRADVEFLMYREKRSLTKNFENIYADREKLLNPLWRRDIVNSLLSYGESLKLGISQVLLEEYLIEKVLGQVLKEDKSPHWNQARGDLGTEYGFMNLKKAEGEISRLKAQRSFIESELIQLEAPQDGWKDKLQQLDRVIKSIETELRQIPEFGLIAT